MDKMFIYRGENLERALDGKRYAVLSFANSPMSTNQMLKKAETLDGGISQIKRWISTSSFSVIVIEDLSRITEGRSISDFLFWLKDHAEDFEGPYVIIKEKESREEITKLAKAIDSEEGISINIR